jgi:hypothetical protein
MRILREFDKWLLNDSSWEKKAHYASSINACTRQQYYGWIGLTESNPNTAGSILKMKFGYLAEDLLEKFFISSIKNETLIDGKKLIKYEMGWKEKYEIKELKYPITCKLDFVLFFDDNTEFAVELKSSFGRGIVEIAKTQTPKKDYLDQIFVYIYLTPFKNFIHPYLGRDNGYRTEFEVEKIDEGLKVIYTTYEEMKKEKIYYYHFDDIIEKLKNVENYLEVKEEPPRDFLVAIKNGEIKDLGFQDNKIKYTSDWQCNYCVWRDYCWFDELEKYKDNNNSKKFIERKKKIRR